MKENKIRNYIKNLHKTEVIDLIDEYEEYESSLVLQDGNLRKLCEDFGSESTIPITAYIIAFECYRYFY
jgi:hypothetical protein